MDFQEAIVIIKEKFPRQAIEIAECLGLLLESIDSTISDVSKQTAASMESRDFTKLKTYGELVETIYLYESHIQQIKEDLEIDEKETTSDDDDSTYKDINYDDYKVDINIPHTLYESFTFKRPVAFELNEMKIEVKTWRDMLLETCEFLINISPITFENFQNDPKMNGKKTKYFSISGAEMRGPVKLKGIDLFIETNMGANSIRNLIAKMLSKYGIKISSFKVYFRADYSALHENE